MVDLVLNRRQNYANVRLAEGVRESVGYELPSGERRFALWLGFIERSRARRLPGARPVRLADITRIGIDTAHGVEWEDLPPGRYVHGCLTHQGAYAVYDATVCLVGPRSPRP